MAVGPHEPDIFWARGESAGVLDVQVVSGSQPLNRTAREKEEKYDTIPDLQMNIWQQHHLTGNQKIRFNTATLSWSWGIWSRRSALQLQVIRLPRGLLTFISTRVLQGSHTNFTRFMQMTAYDVGQARRKRNR
ncbi:uncharacterized protein LOC120352952 [Nilaparvata lugens]|uniref:uncharacterized protein LOC120352952 n=1 Tax=Nilaparvata lugens TaxID=108931 RepID=UPI00193E0E35|nr:uncharacterized protein LOC120352952 [Nilaparvata lugens]